MRGKRGALTVTFPAQKMRHKFWIYFEGFPFWEYGSRFNQMPSMSRAALIAFVHCEFLDLEDQDKVAAAIIIPPEEAKTQPEEGTLLR